MKKWIGMILAACILLSSSGALAGGAIPNFLAEPTPAPAPSVPSSTFFSFRGGIQWNMPRETVQALESVELMEQNRDSWSILLSLSQVTVSRYTADLVYMFYNDQLKMISYDFGTGSTAADFQYLTGALDSVYGDHSDPSPADIIGVMDQIYPGYYSADRLTLRRGWSTEGTLIYLYYYAENSFAILYVNAASVSPVFDTTGL